MRYSGLVAALACGVVAAPLFAADHTVTLTGGGFFPDRIHPQIGDTVVFVNRTDEVLSAAATDGSWQTGSLQPDQEYRLPIAQGMTQSFSDGGEGSGFIDYNNPADVALGSN
jgi:plastocyanin